MIIVRVIIVMVISFRVGVERLEALVRLDGVRNILPVLRVQAETPRRMLI